MTSYLKGKKLGLKLMRLLGIKEMGGTGLFWSSRLLNPGITGMNSQEMLGKLIGLPIPKAVIRAALKTRIANMVLLGKKNMERVKDRMIGVAQKSL
jgi:hypothetical protein